MDTSNPVIESDRVKLFDARNDNLMLKRQCYKTLKALVEGGERINPLKFPIEPVELDKTLIDALVDSGIVPNGEKLEGLLTLSKKLDGLPLSKYHPQGVNQKGPLVCVNRVFPQRRRIRGVLESILRYQPEAHLDIEKITYSGGTTSGFAKRLIKWDERKLVQETSYLKTHGFSVEDVLDKHLRYDEKLLPNWNNPLNELLNEIEVNKTSGAGPPYFQPKWKVLDNIFHNIREISNAISDGTIDEFFSMNREFLMAECKNKMDRYELEKIQTKTRPYWNFSAPVSFLISILCQGITKSLFTFEEKGSNAYGFSYAHGGGKKMWEWMTSCKEGEKKYTVYGDDGLFVFRLNGVLYEINPDFEQMDASVDSDLISKTTNWVYRQFEKKHGPSPFFKYVADMWAKLASESDFFVHGTGVYGAKGRLRTGVVGTTLFDTAKAMCAYTLFIHEKINPLDVEASIAYFRNHGLVVKAGTWEPRRIVEELEENTVCKEQKFLGCKLAAIQGRDYLEPVPYVDESDLNKLIGNMRQEEAVNVNQKTSYYRRLFDSARGYMITAVFHHQELWNSMADIIESVPPEIVTMRVQTGNGLGSRPENLMIVGEDFQWPSSDGFPTIEFCRNVYLTKDNLHLESPQGLLWQHVFPALVPELVKYRKYKQYLELVKTVPNDWNADMAAEQVEDKINPPIGILPEEVILTNTPFRLPKNIVKWRPKEEIASLETKQQRMLSYLDGVLEVHHRGLDVVFPYGQHFLTTFMLEQKEWYWTAHGMWTKDPLQQAKHVTTAWSTVAAKVLGFNKNITPPTTEVKNVPDIPREDVFVEPNLTKFFDGIPKFPKIEDSVSFVSAVFLQAGNPILEESKVITQAPSRVEVKLTIKGSSQIVGTAIKSNKKEAKKILCDRLKNELLETYALRELPPEDPGSSLGRRESLNEASGGEGQDRGEDVT